MSMFSKTFLLITFITIFSACGGGNNDEANRFTDNSTSQQPIVPISFAESGLSYNTSATQMKAKIFFSLLVAAKAQTFLKR